MIGNKETIVSVSDRGRQVCGLSTVYNVYNTVGGVGLLTYPFWALHVPGQTQQELMGDRIHQVKEGRILIQNVIKGGTLQSQILERDRQIGRHRGRVRDRERDRGREGETDRKRERNTQEKKMNEMGQCFL